MGIGGFGVRVAEMIVKKIASKPFHNANGLNGDGGKIHAKYGVFKDACKLAWSCAMGRGRLSKWT